MSFSNMSRHSAHGIRILGHSYDEYAAIIRRFHGNEAPGVIIGGFMVDLAIRSLLTISFTMPSVKRGHACPMQSRFSHRARSGTAG
jgi:hypothetical protein